MSEHLKPSAPLVELGLGLAWLLGIAAALQILDRLLPPASLATPLVGALLVDVATSRVGVRWDLASTERGPTLDYGAIARRLAAGAGVAVAIAAVVLAVAAALGWFHSHGGVHPSFAMALALLRAGSISARDELLYRGLPLVVLARAGLPAGAARIFAALAGGAAIALMPGVAPPAIALAVASGWLFAGLWQKDGGAFAAVGAHAAWILVFGSILHGGLFEIEWTSAGNIAIGNGSTGAPAWLAAGLCVALGLVLPRIPWPGRGAVSV